VENSKANSSGAIKAGQTFAIAFALPALRGGHESKALRVTSGTGYMIPTSKRVWAWVWVRGWICVRV